jgi:hypothetical protein
MARPASTGLRLSALGGWVTVCAALWIAAHAAFAQAPQAQQAPQPQFAPAPQSPPQQQQDAPPSPKREGFFDSFGRWFDKSSQDFKAKIDESNARWRSAVEENNAKWRSAVEENNARWRDLNRKTEQAAKDAAVQQKEATEDFRKAQKEAAEAFKNLSNLRVVEGRQVCATAANGSPDCQPAAEAICKSKGFSTGKSADITTTRKCSARALLQRDESDCRTETVVIKAACQ